MLSRLSIRLDTEEELSYQMSSLFHGALIEGVTDEYARLLHNSRLHPFSQHLEFRDGSCYWVVNCLNKEARDNIIFDFLMKKEEIEIRKKALHIGIREKEYKEIQISEISDRFYNTPAERYIQLHFITPTAFKQSGRYLFFPDLRCIYQSLMNKYDAANETEQMFDEEALEELSSSSEISRYDIKSTVFHMEGVRIPSFIGKITIKAGGNSTMAAFARLLLEFGAYSGVGIKNSIGMGAYKIISQGEKK